VEPEPVCCQDGVIYNNFCDARCMDQQEAPPERCTGGELVPLDCRRDEDCRRTGCGGIVCAAADTAACPTYSADAGCLALEGRCGCERGFCQFEPTRESLRCQEELRGSDAGPGGEWPQH
jgi:hypothetical protein